MFNVQQITSRLAELSDAQLAQYARMHKDDPYILPLASSEFKRRQQLRQSGQMQQGGPKPTVADQEIAMMDQDNLPEDQGIGVLPAQNIATMADGGIAGYAEGGPVSFADGGTKKGGKFDPDAYLQNPNVDKFLRYLNVYEGSPKANQLVGFKEFSGFDDHPRTPVVFNKKGATSDAAGMFQIMSKTWDYQRKKLGLSDFSPENQKRAAIGILKDIGALQDIVQGNFDAAKAKATRQWASLPGSTIGKSTGQNPRYKPQAEAILEQPATQQAQNQPAQNQPQRQKERTLGERLFDVLPFSKAGAAEAPQQLADFESRLAAARDAYKTRFGKDMPVTSENRTRAQQQKLYDDWKAGKPGVYTPVNPADYPGRKMFHENAADIDPRQVPESFLREFGLHRPLGKRDPVHAVAMPNWTPSGDTRTATAKTDRQTPARVEQFTPSTYQSPVPVAQDRNARAGAGITSIIPSAQAAEVNPVSQAPAVRNTSPRAQTPSANTVVAQTNPPAPAPAPKAAPKAAERDDIVYEPSTGLPIFGGLAYQAGPKTEAPVTSLMTGAADVFLGIPEAIANVVARNYYNLPVGKTYSWEEASQAAADNPVVKAAGYLRSGKWFGVENDPAYRKDPLSIITSLPSLGVQGIANKFGINEEAAQLALDNALLLAPVVKKGAKGSWQVEYNVPKKEKPPAPTEEGIAQLRTEADAAAAKVAAPRLEAPPQSIRVGPDGKAILPEPRTSETPAARALAEDTRAKQETARRLQEAEAAKAAAAKAETATARNAKALETYQAITGVTPKITPMRALSGGADFSTTTSPSATEGVSLNETRPNPSEYFRRVAELKVPEAKRVAEQVTEAAPPPQAPKTSGFSNEDILMLGLNMMMAPPGQSGGALSQLASNIGRSGIATLQARRDRAKLEADQAYRDMYGKYIQAQTAQMGREPEDIRSLRLLEADPKLMQTLARKQVAGDITGANASLIAAWAKYKKDREMLGETPSFDDFIKGVPAEYLPGGGVGFGMPQGVTVTRSGT